MHGKSHDQSELFQGFLERLYNNRNQSVNQTVKDSPSPFKAPKYRKTNHSSSKESSKKSNKNNAAIERQNTLEIKTLKQSSNRKDHYDFEIDVDGSIFANHELSKHTMEKKNSLPTGIDARASKMDSHYDKVEFETISESEEAYQSKNDSVQDRMHYKRKSFEKASKNKKTLLPMLLKFKENGKTIDLTHSPLKQKSTINGSRYRFNRETTFANALSKAQNGSADSIGIHTGDNNENNFDKGVNETLSYFHQNKPIEVAFTSYYF